MFVSIASDRRALDAVIRVPLGYEGALIRTFAEFIVSAGGESLRAARFSCGYKALGYKGTDDHLLAAVVEFIHTATLLHDDVVDESDLRRGRSTANAVFGNAASVLVGDYLYSRSFEMMVETRSMQAMAVLSAATTVIAEGEVLQLLNVHDPEVSEERYMQGVRYKTAKLFEAATEVGAILGAADASLQEAAAPLWRQLGTAFQLIDDVLDYSGDADALGKNVGDDLREGKPTLPLIRVMEVGTDEEKALIRNAIETGDADFDAVARAIANTDAVEYTRIAARNEAQLALDALAQFPQSESTDALHAMCRFSIERDR